MSKRTSTDKTQTIVNTVDVRKVSTVSQYNILVINYNQLQFVNIILLTFFIQRILAYFILISTSLHL